MLMPDSEGGEDDTESITSNGSRTSTAGRSVRSRVWSAMGKVSVGKNARTDPPNAKSCVYILYTDAIRCLVLCPVYDRLSLLQPILPVHAARK